MQAGLRLVHSMLPLVCQSDNKATDRRLAPADPRLSLFFTALRHPSSCPALKPSEARKACSATTWQTLWPHICTGCRRSASRAIIKCHQLVNQRTRSRSRTLSLRSSAGPHAPRTLAVRVVQARTRHLPLPLARPFIVVRPLPVTRPSAPLEAKPHPATMTGPHRPTQAPAHKHRGTFSRMCGVFCRSAWPSSRRTCCEGLAAHACRIVARTCESTQSSVSTIHQHMWQVCVLACGTALTYIWSCCAANYDGMRG